MTPMEDSPIAIDVQQLSKSYHRRPDAPFALRDFSFQLPLGKTLCVLGPNGSGKTTLLKILASLLEPTSGSLSILGVDPMNDPGAVRANLGWMPAEERSGFYGRLTGRENLKFFAALQNIPPSDLDRRIGNLSVRLGLGDELDRMLLKISGGQRQKIALARALLHDPAVLILDEPMLNLDPHTTQRFRRLIKDHLTRTEGKTVVMSTHQLEEARRIADFIAIVHQGELVKFMNMRDVAKETRDSSLEEYYLKTIDALEKQ